MISSKPADWEIKWISRDGGRKPQVMPNPAFPHGVDVDGSDHEKPTCQAALPYVLWPERGLGMLLIKCKQCGVTAGVTTAGRPDDPVSLRINCKQN